MRRHTLVILLALCLSTLALAVVAGCAAPNTSGGGQNNGRTMMGGNGSGTNPSGGGVTGGGSGTYSSVGERIFLTGVGSDGQAIKRTGATTSQGSRMMMSGNGCGSCHGANGRGGTIGMMMRASIKTPDITYAALSKAGFTDTTIKRAIRDGLDEADKPLKDPMPRWQMSDADVAATIAYLKQLSGQ